MPNHSPTRGVPISGTISADLRDRLRIAGDGNLSEGIRRALEAPPQTPSGASWIAHPTLLPDPATADGPAILAMPAGLLAHGVGPNGWVVDLEKDQLIVSTPGADVAADLSLSFIANIAGRMLPALLDCLAQRPGADKGFHIGNGIVVRLLTHGLVEFVPHCRPDAGLVLPARHALQLAAEMSALLSRRVAEHQDTVAALEALAVAPEVPEVPA